MGRRLFECQFIALEGEETILEDGPAKWIERVQEETPAIASVVTGTGHA